VLESDLHALVDGALPEDRRQEVEAHLRGNPEAAARVRAWRAQNEGLRALYDGVLSEPVPARLALAPVVRVRLLPRLSAAAALLLLGGSVGWLAKGAVGGQGPAPSSRSGAAGSLARFAAVAHAVYTPEVRHPVEVGADQESHLVAWLSKRLGAELRPPRLGGLGFELMGGRLLPGAGAAAQFMYREASGQRLTLYVSVLDQGGEDTAFRFSQEGKVSVFYWVDGRLGYALSAGMPRADLLRVAEAVYAQLGK
jgi:anti-sigma factor RsiW